MKTAVIDASIIAAVFFQEEHAAKAEKVLTSGAELLAPDLIFAELASVAWKRHARDEITHDDALALLTDMQRIPLNVTSIRSLVAPALTLALSTERTIYDCLYVTLAMQNQCAMWTADRRLVNALAKSPVRKHVRWIGE